MVRALMNDKITETTKDISIFTAVWYVLMITTAGVWVPAGLFVPGMIVGSGLGLLTKQLLGLIEFNQNPLLGASY